MIAVQKMIAPGNGLGVVLSTKACIKDQQYQSCFQSIFQNVFFSSKVKAAAATDISLVEGTTLEFDISA